MKIAVCPGSFDPATNGHIDIIERSSKIFDVVIAAVLRNPAKDAVFTVDERIQMLVEATNHLPNVRVESFNGLMVDFARNVGATTIIKGLRAVSDFEYEFQMASINNWLDHDIETLFMMTSPNNAYLSSSAVKQVARFGGSVAGLVPNVVEKWIKGKFTYNDERPHHKNG